MVSKNFDVSHRIRDSNPYANPSHALPVTALRFVLTTLNRFNFKQLNFLTLPRRLIENLVKQVAGQPCPCQI